jgi:sigma-B regulation protein RsbU (phosphoserine phosphatase)
MPASEPSRVPTSRTTATSELQPVLMLLDGTDQRSLVLDHSPFRIGRKSDNDLVLPDTRVSRAHAELIFENNAHFLVDLASKHGTYVNGERITRHQLTRNDRIEVGARDGLILVFAPTKPHSSSREFLRQITAIPSGKSSDLEKLRVFLDAARKLNSTSVLDDILATLLETSLRLTQAERGFVYLLGSDGELRLALGQDAKGEPIADDKSISRSVVREAARSGGEFMVSDTLSHSSVGSRESVIQNELRSMVCIPLRKVQGRDANDDDETAPVLGVLYLDSKVVAHDMSATSHDILRAISSEAASLLENAQLAQAEQAARRYQQELTIAAGFQQRLMSVRIPEVGWAKIVARNIPCTEIGGDFYDVVRTPDGVALIVCDVCGKGVSAALLASILQGMLFSNLTAGMPLKDIVESANRFLCDRDLSEKYATMVVVKLRPDGAAEYINCGQVSPVIVQDGKVTRPDVANVPVGMMSDVKFETGTFKLARGARLLLVTDGITEAENKEYEFFGDVRLEKHVAENDPIEKIVAAVQKYRNHVPLADDVTLLDLEYSG